MADPKTTGLGCSVLLDVDPDGRPVYCGAERGTRKDPRQERYDVGLCPKHWREAFPEDEQVVRVIADALWEIGDKQEAEGVLAALRDAGFDIYRPDDCPTGQELTGHPSDAYWLLVRVGR